MNFTVFYSPIGSVSIVLLIRTILRVEKNFFFNVSSRYLYMQNIIGTLHAMKRLKEKQFYCFYC